MLPLTTLEPWPIGRCKMRICRSWPLETDVELVGLIQKLCWHRGPTRCSVAVGPDGRLGCKGQTSVTRGVEGPWPRVVACGLNGGIIFNPRT